MSQLDHITDLLQEQSRQLIELRELIRSIPKRREWMTVKEAAEYLKLSEYHVRHRLKSEIGYSQRGRKILFKREDLDKWIERNFKTNQ